MITGTDHELGLHDEDRLPWLEAVESDDGNEGGSSTKLIGFLLVGLAALGLIVGGVWWLRSQQPGIEGDGTLIAAPAGDYKVKPDAPGGMKVEGQGDSTFAASEGAEANGKVDTTAQPETPVAGQKVDTKTTPKPVAVGKSVVTAAVPASGGTLTAPGGTQIQLGAYASEAIANESWDNLVQKNPALKALPKSVVSATVGGKRFYRLRADAGSRENASAMCAQVGNCMIVR